MFLSEFDGEKLKDVSVRAAGILSAESWHVNGEHGRIQKGEFLFSFREQTVTNHFLVELSKDGGLESLVESAAAGRLSVHDIDSDLTATAIRGDILDGGVNSSHDDGADFVAGALEHEELQLSPSAARNGRSVLQIDETEEIICVVVDRDGDSRQDF